MKLVTILYAYLTAVISYRRNMGQRREVRPRAVTAKGVTEDEEDAAV